MKNILKKFGIYKDIRSKNSDPTDIFTKQNKDYLIVSNNVKKCECKNTKHHFIGNSKHCNKCGGLK